MQPGDSFVLPADTTLQRARMIAQQAKNKHGGKWRARQADDGIGIWRVE